MALLVKVAEARGGIKQRAVSGLFSVILNWSTCHCLLFSHSILHITSFISFYFIF